jgi:hypothetical protein
MTEFTKTAMRSMCRNPRCRSELPAPVSNPRDAFCARGCHTAFYANGAWSAKGQLSVVATIRKSAAKLSAAALGGLERASAATLPHPLQSCPRKSP